MEKTCRVCKETKPYADLKKNSKSKDGVEALCNTCNSARALAAYERKKSNPEEIQRRRETSKKWVKENREHARKWRREYRRKRYANDSDYRQKCLDYANDYRKKQRDKR